MDRLRFPSDSEVHWQRHDRWARQVDSRPWQGVMLPRANGSARAATAEHA